MDYDINDREPTITEIKEKLENLNREIIEYKNMKKRYWVWFLEILKVQLS